MRILCYGDSNTWGYHPGDGVRYDSRTRWAARLARLTGWEVVEEGLNGRTTVFYAQDEHYRCGYDFVEPCVLSHIPLDWIAVMLGSNDTKCRYQASAQDIADGMARVIDWMRECCARKGQYPRILLIAPPRLDSSLTGEEFPDFDAQSDKTIVEIEALYEQLAREKDCVFLRASDVVTDIGSDGLHMTQLGHKNLAEAAARVLLAESGTAMGKSALEM